MVSAIAGGFAVAVVLGYLVLRYPPAHAYAVDLPAGEPQKFHHRPTPRIGGVAVLAGLAFGTFALEERFGLVRELLGLSLLCSLFAFAGGLAEDFTRRVRARLRLLLSFISAALGFFVLDARISALSIPGIDWALQFSLVSLAVTVFAVGGFAQAMNIVDGFNGLAGVVAMILLGALAVVAHTVGDQPIMWACLVLGGAILGFLMFNFPRGLIFLGDGGAYMIGFLIAEFAVLLVHRNTEVSPWFALTVLSYPVVETVFSIYRKHVLRGRSPGCPDGLHLHMLIYRRLVRQFRLRRRTDLSKNSATSPFLWVLTLIGAIPAVIFWDRTGVLQGVVLAFAAFYVWMYWRIIRFRTPKALRLLPAPKSAYTGRRHRRKSDPAYFGRGHRWKSDPLRTREVRRLRTWLPQDRFQARGRR